MELIKCFPTDYNILQICTTKSIFSIRTKRNFIVYAVKSDVRVSFLKTENACHASHDLKCKFVPY